MRLPGIGLFGTGDVVLSLVPFLRSKGFRIEAIWGSSLQEAEDVANALDIPFRTNKIDDVLLKKEVDLIFIMCQPDLHAQIAVKSLGIGKHVLCDRPAGLCQLEVLKMVNAAQYYPSLISVISHGLRFHPAFVKAKNLLNENRIGQLNFCDIKVQCGSLIGKNFDWMCSNLMGGGVLSMIGTHLIDIIRYVTGLKVTRVNGTIKTFTKNTNKINGIRWIDSDDFCSFQMVLENDVFVTCTINSHIPGKFTQELIFGGSQGSMVISDSMLYLYNLLGKQEVLYTEDSTLFPVSIPHDNTLPSVYLKGLFLMISAMKEAFRCGEGEHGWLKEPVCNAATFEDGQYVQAVIDAIKLSSSSRQWEQVTLSNVEAELNPLLGRLNLPNLNLDSLEALSQASTKATSQRKQTHSESHLSWSFVSGKH